MMRDKGFNPDHYKWGENCDAWRLLQSESLSVISEKMPDGTSETLHYHSKSQQVFYILSGEATFEINGETIGVSANESLHIAPKNWHRILNNSQGDLAFLVISEPSVEGDRIELLDYSDELKTHIKTLNYEWLEKFFKVEPGDAKSLSNPKQEILDKGGFIWFVRFRGQIVGTVSLLKKPDGAFEIGKMAVSQHFQGFGIGNMLVSHCLNEAKKLGIPKLILYSNTKLAPAIHLYRKFGFVEDELEAGLYERANIKMVKTL